MNSCWTPFTAGWRPRLQDRGTVRLQDPGWAVPPSTLVLVSPIVPFPAVLRLGMHLVDAEWEVSPGSLGKWLVTNKAAVLMLPHCHRLLHMHSTWTKAAAPPGIPAGTAVTKFHYTWLSQIIIWQRNGFKVKRSRFRLGIKRKFFILRHWDRLPGEAVDASALEALEAAVRGSLSNLV